MGRLLDCAYFCRFSVCMEDDDGSLFVCYFLLNACGGSHRSSYCVYSGRAGTHV